MGQPMYQCERLDPIKLPLINKFYRQYGARGKAKSNEQLWVVKSGAQIVAGARIGDISGCDFLTGVLVAPEYQGKGIATKLIQALLHGRDKPLYSFPYCHLMAMYQKLGFKALPIERLPKPLLMRFERYQKQGRNIGAAVADIQLC